MGITSLPARFAAHVRAADLLRPGQRIMVALSGGLDSTCLLHLLRFGAPVPGAMLQAVHYDHGMRPDSAADAAWVRGVCRAWDVPLARARASEPPSSEAAARALRYEFLHQAARSCAADVVLTAHHADDQLETLLFRLARGTGLRGLRGIPQQRGSLVRPLLPFRRAELAAYAREARLRWREDESNLDTTYARNRIRRVLLPALESAWPQAPARLAQLAAIAEVLERVWQRLLPELADAVVEGAADGRFQLARSRLLEYHPQTRARVLRWLAHRLGSPLDRAGTRAAADFSADGESGTAVRLGSRLELTREFERLTLSRIGPGAAADADLPLRIDSAGAGAGRARIGGTWFMARWGPLPPGGAAAVISAAFDPSVLHFPLELRGWRPGDRIRLGYGTKKLKKLFGERRVARSRRAAIPVLAEQGGNGGVLWVADVARATPPTGANEGWHITVSDAEPA